MNRLLLAILVLLSFSCTSNRNETEQDKANQTENTNIACLPDSCVFKPNFPILVNEFLASPFSENKILLLDFNGENYQTDTDFSELTNLQEILGYVGRGVRKEGIIKDPYNDSLIWAIGFHEGLVIHNLISKKNTEFLNQTYFNRSSLTCIYILKNHALIGSSDGLFKINRKDNKISKVEQFTGIWIKDILYFKPNEFIINDNYIFEDKSNNIKPFQSVNDTTYNVIKYYRNIDNAITFTYETNKTKVIFPNGRVKNYYNNFPHPLCFIYKDELWDICGKITCYNFQNNTNISVPFNEIITAFSNEDSIMWFTSQNLIFKLNKDNKKIYRYPIEFSHINKIFPFNNYIFLNQGDRITRLSKKAINKALLLNDKFAKEETQFNNLYNSLNNQYDDPFDILVNFSNLKREYANSKSTIIINKLNETAANKISYTIQSLTNENYDTIRNKLNPDEFQSIKDAILFGLTRKHGINREIELSLKYYNLLKSEYPNSYLLKQFPEKEIQRLENIMKEIELINNDKCTADAKLWRKYNCFANNIFESYFQGEMFSRPYEYNFLDTIILLFPNSEYADNAEWIIEIFNNSASYEDVIEPVYSFKELEFYHRFLNKFPNSELLPKILQSMAYVYTHAGDSIDIRLKNIDSAEYIYKRLLKEFPDFSKKENIESYNDLKNKLLKGNLGWQLSIKTNKLTYNRDEPIEIEFILENKTNHKRTLEIKEGIPNFYIRLSGENEFIEIPENKQTPKKTITIEPLGKYHEKWNIKEMIKSDYNEKPGFIKIGNTNELTILGSIRFFNSEPVSSNVMQIKIID